MLIAFDGAPFSQQTWAMVETEPVYLLGPPLVLLALLLGLGIWAVYYISQQNDQQARSLAQDLANTAAAAIQLQVYRTYQPALTLAALLPLTRNWALFEQDFHDFSQSLFDQVLHQVF